MTCPRCHDKTDRTGRRAYVHNGQRYATWDVPIICSLCLLELEHWTEHPPQGWMLIGPHKWPAPEPKGAI